MKKQIIGLSLIAIALTSCGTNFSKSAAPSSLCEHSLLESEVKAPTLLETGINEIRCVKCGQISEKATYDLSQYVFEDGYYMYDRPWRRLRAPEDRPEYRGIRLSQEAVTSS